MYQTILQKINAVSDANTPLLIAIDGRCASGKTTLSSYLLSKMAKHFITIVMTAINK